MYKHIRYSHLSQYKLRLLINDWISEIPARECARRIHVNWKTVLRYYQLIRLGLARLPDPPPFSGIVEVDESYFGAKPHGVYGRGTYGRVPFFGMKERSSGRVWVCIVPINPNHQTLLPIICKRIQPGSIIYSDGFGAYAHLRDLGYDHRVVNHSKTYVTSDGVHTNGIESFWAYANHHFQKLRGLPRNRYAEHLREVVVRFNTSDRAALRLLVRKILRGEV